MSCKRKGSTTHIRADSHTHTYLILAMSTPVIVMMTWSPATAQEAGLSLTASAVERDPQKNIIQLQFEQ